MVVFPQSATVQIQDVAQPLDPVADLLDLVDLLLIGGDDELGAAMTQHIGDLLAHCVLIERHRDRPGALNGDHRHIKLRTVASDDGDMLADLQAERDQAKGHLFDLGAGLIPGPLLPDAEFFLAIGGRIGKGRRVPVQKLRNRVQVGHVGRPPSAVLTKRGLRCHHPR
mgnify:CR=1 FL=1